MDTLSEKHRSWNMSRIRGRNTKPEMIVRSLLRRLGYRFRLHRRDLPGKPDIALPRQRTTVFVHGCFWHRHSRCKSAYTPKSNIAFWNAKFEDNIARDRRVRRDLRRLGWRVIIVWECQTSDASRLCNRLTEAFSSKVMKPPKTKDAW
jgi:DNA mismatch endonuclease, patch repair protein